MPTMRTKPSAKKSFFAGTHRTVDPEETWARILPVFPDVGITRVADVTGLDCIGIPVCNAIRPNARSLSVSQGKGIARAHARVSAAMEAIELFHAERVRPGTETSGYYHLGAARSIDPRQFSRLPGVRSAELLQASITWIEGYDLMTGRPKWVPRDVVSCDLRPDAPTDALFLTSSNGLGSGNTLEEASLHALCEVIERDATCLHQVLSSKFSCEPALIDAATVDDPLCCWLMDRITGADIDIYIWAQLGDLEIPSFGCAISDNHGGRIPGAPIGTFQGYGCHPDRGVALSRAITEAVQSRLTYISGARDDLFRDDYASIQTSRNRRGWLAWLNGNARKLDFRTMDSWATSSVSTDLDRLLSLLEKHGFDQAVIVDIGIDSIGIPVVKALVPGMIEPNMDNKAPSGRRVENFLAQWAAPERDFGTSHRIGSFR